MSFSVAPASARAQTEKQKGHENLLGDVFTSLVTSLSINPLEPHCGQTHLLEKHWSRNC